MVSHFLFEHDIFQSSQTYFSSYGAAHEPVLAVDFGKYRGVFSITRFCEEYRVEPKSHDGRLVQMAIRSLRFVDQVRNGDAVPSELIDGSPSWDVPEKFRRLAARRLGLAIITWFQKEQVAKMGRAAMIEAAGSVQPVDLRAALVALACALDEDPGNLEWTCRKLGLWTVDISYTELQRQKARTIKRLLRDVLEMAPRSMDRQARAELSRVKQLVPEAMLVFQRTFDDLEYSFTHPVDSLKNFDATSRTVRDVRDEVRALLRIWEPAIAALVKGSEKASGRARAVGAFYRFLAARLVTGKSIVKLRPPRRS